MESPDEVNQLPQNIDVSQDDDKVKDIQTVFDNGMRAMAGTYLLDRFQLALSIHLVNSNRIDENCNLTQWLRQLKPKKLKDVQEWLQDILNEIGQMPNYDDAEKTSALRRIDTNASDALNAVDETDDRFHKSLLLQSAKDVIDKQWKRERLPRQEDFEDFRQKMRVGTVHGMLSNAKVGWKQYHDWKEAGDQFFVGWEWLHHGPDTDIIKDIFKQRNEGAHTSKFDGNEDNIHTFVAKFDKVDKFLDRYFPDVTPEMDAEGRRRHLKYLFPDIPAHMTTNKLMNAYENFKKRLIDRVPDLMSEVNGLTQRVSYLEMEQVQLAGDIVSMLEKHKSELTESFSSELQKRIPYPQRQPRDDPLVGDLEDMDHVAHHQQTTVHIQQEEQHIISIDARIAITLLFLGLSFYCVRRFW